MLLCVHAAHLSHAAEPILVLPSAALPRAAGEWFEAKAQPGHKVEPLDEQRDAVVASLWKTVSTGAGVAAAVGQGGVLALCKRRMQQGLGPGEGRGSQQMELSVWGL